MILRNINLDLDEGRKFLGKIRHVLPVLCGYLLSVSFGMMLGWPSLAFPHLLNWEISSIPIQISQTSLVAGFLMEGNSLGVLFSTSKCLGSKTAVFFCFCLQFFGWCVMFGANDLIGLFVSRASVGFGNGCGIGHLKRYIRETCEPELAEKLAHYIPLGVPVGVLLIYSAGAAVEFRIMSVFSMMIPFFATIIFGLLPKRMLNGESDMVGKNVFKKTVTLDLAKVEECSNEKTMSDDVEESQASPIECLKDPRSRNALLVIFLVVFLQQYTGGPANIVYSQIIFTQTLNPHPKVCSIIYAIFFMVITVVSLKYTKSVPRKANLLTSCGMTALTTALMSLYFHLKDQHLLMSHYFSWAPLFILILFNVFHTFGIATVPLYIIQEKMPKRARNVANKFLVINFSMSAVISTKIFQVLFDLYDMCIAYAFFVGVAIVGFVLLAVFVEEYDPIEEKRKTDEKKVEGNANEISIISRL